MNSLVNPIIRAADGPKQLLFTLPGVLAALVRDEIESFPALRAHHRHAWHTLLAQLGALALINAGRDDLPEHEAVWTALLRGLTPDYQNDEPWGLVAPPDKPALLQPPLPGGRLDDLKNLVRTPDALDMLVTAKNHDLKAEVMAEAEPDAWLFALVTLQTMEGFLGAGNYGISRMNGGFANRAAVSVVPAGGPGAHLRRDIRRLLQLRGDKRFAIYPPHGGLALVWLRPWDGTASLRPDELDPYYIEICRRVRLFEQDGRIVARTAGSKVPRIVPIPGGMTGDPWAPVVTGKEPKVFTADAGGFGYRRMVRLMFSEEVRPAPLQAVADDDDREGLLVLARALVRGQGRTEGYHERRVPVSRIVLGMLGRRETTDEIAAAARHRVLLAGEIQGQVLKPALLTLFQNGGPENSNRPGGIEKYFKPNDRGSANRAEPFLDRFDQIVDRDFFPRLWEEFEEGRDRGEVLRRWVSDLLDAARALLGEADRGASKAVKRRYRARALADDVLAAAPLRNKHLSPYVGAAP